MSVTFEVSDVEPAHVSQTTLDTKPTTSWPPLLELAALKLGLTNDEPFDWTGRIQGWGGAEDIHQFFEGHGFLSAAMMAFAHHHPLCLSPDHIWTLISQGLAQHIAQDPEHHRASLVSHEGKLKLKVRRDDFVLDSLENPWAEVVSSFCDQIRDHIGPERHALLTPSFSTTGPLEALVSQVGLMDAMSHYFEFVLYTLCGIPRITLEGTPEDWRELYEHATLLEDFGLSWWLDALLPVLQGFVDASQGRISRTHWRSFVKANDGSGGPYVTGWITDLFPYTSGFDSTFTQRVIQQNPHLGQLDSQFSVDAFPYGLSEAQVRWEYLGQTIPLHLNAGFFGTSMRPDATLRPELGWVIRRTNP